MNLTCAYFGLLFFPWSLWVPREVKGWEATSVSSSNYIIIPGPSSLGAKWFRYRVSISNPLGFNCHPTSKVLVSEMSFLVEKIECWGIFKVIGGESLGLSIIVVYPKEILPSLKLNIAPENRPSQKDTSSLTIHFQVLC